jgi:hypothetical protein
MSLYINCHTIIIDHILILLANRYKKEKIAHHLS